MSGMWGNHIKLSIFGESHGEGIGIVIDGLAGNIKLDLEKIKEEMNRRSPGKSPLTTSRKEKDAFEIISGYFNDKTTGTPLCAVIKNQNTRSKDYEKTKNILRPSHGDYTGHIKYFGANDYRGGGHFSGRLTAPLVFAGAIAKQLLEKKNIFIGSHILSIGTVKDRSFDFTSIKKESLNQLVHEDFPVIDQKKKQEMQNFILKAKQEGDSCGGIIETAIINFPEGVGSPFFDSIESTLSHLLFSIPAVKGVEFGSGFNMAQMRGSEANDEFFIEKDKIKTYTNHNGGILGGISSGMPIVFKAGIKPTPSIGKIQKSVDIQKKENVSFQIEGRHDPCIVPRAVAVVESVAAIGLLDLLIEKDGIEWMN